jgi:CheY-like chemotaxis protein
MVDIIIVDTGVGIAKEEQTLVFEPFTRLTYAEHHEIQGTGIGLALAKFLVQQMNGEIAIESKFGEGSSFHVLLQQGEHPDALQRDMLTSHVTRSLLPQARGGHTILYIEDNLSNRELFRGIVSNYPHIVLQTANTAEEGIEVADREIPGIIFVDINLPRMDGIDCFKALRSNPDLANSKIIAISADVLPEQIAIAVEAGFDDYITKPIDVDQINGILDSFTKMFDV